MLGGYWNRTLCLVFRALGKRQKTLGKPFAKCHTRQSRDRKKITAKQVLSSVFFRALGKAFAECLFDTRQTKVTVTANLTEQQGLPSVYSQTLGKDIFFKKIGLPSVFLGTLGKVPSLPNVLDTTLGKAIRFA